MLEILRNQMLAALATLNQAINNCPDAEWNEVHNDAPFSQVIFHTLIFLDLYLSKDEEDFKAQIFHKEHKEIFKSYEELEDKLPVELYTREKIDTYFQFCRKKIEAYFGETIKKDPLEKTSFRRGMSVMELAIYNTRHVQHHAAQLGLRVQQITGKQLKWVSTGWK
jgi:hypothetical protein